MLHQACPLLDSSKIEVFDSCTVERKISSKVLPDPQLKNIFMFCHTPDRHTTRQAFSKRNVFGSISYRVVAKNSPLLNHHLDFINNEKISFFQKFCHVLNIFFWEMLNTALPCTSSTSQHGFTS